MTQISTEAKKVYWKYPLKHQTKEHTHTCTQCSFNHRTRGCPIWIEAARCISTSLALKHQSEPKTQNMPLCVEGAIS